MTLHTSIELEVEVDYTYHRATRGARDSCGGVRGAGAPLEPDEPEQVEINSVKVAGVPIELTDEQREKCEQEILEHIADRDIPERD